MPSKTSPTIPPKALAAAKVSLGLTIAFAVILTLLHFVEPEYSPLWRFMSEYSNGSDGWLMRLGFITLAAASAALAPAVWPQLRSKAGKTGAVFLVVTGLGLTLAAFFNQDPITSKEVTTAGSLHGLATMIGIPGFIVGSLLTGYGLARHAKTWAAEARTLRILSNLPWICFVLMLGYMMVAVGKAGGFGPDVWVGLFNRIFMVAMCAWLIFVAGKTIQKAKA